MTMINHQNINVYDIVGNFGKYQFGLLAVNFATSIMWGYTFVFIELLAPSVDLYWDWEASNPNKTIFKSTNCKMADILEYNKIGNVSRLSAKLIYESQYSRRTLTEELNLVCERSWLVSFFNTTLVIGSNFGILFSTRPSEIYGRIRCTQCLTVLCFISNILILFSQGIVMFALVFTIYGATARNVGNFLMFQVVELAPGSKSDYTGTFTKIGILIGQALLVGVAWILKDWFYTQVVQTCCAGVLLISALYLLESPVWLAVRGRYDEAEDTMNRIVVRNGLDLEAAKPKIERYLAQIKRRCEVESSADKGKFSDLFKNRVIMFYTFAHSLSMSLVFFMYLSLVMNAESFGSGLYVDLTISSFLALGAVLLSFAFMTRFSLRTQIIFLGLCGGAVCTVYCFFYDIPVARSVLIILGRCTMSPVIPMLNTFIVQSIPTSVRGISAGFRLMVVGIISSFLPFTKELGQMTAPYVPFIIFTICGFALAGLLKMLPENRGKDMVHTVDELVKEIRENPNAVYTFSSRL